MYDHSLVFLLPSYEYTPTCLTSDSSLKATIEQCNVMCDHNRRGASGHLNNRLTHHYSPPGSTDIPPFDFCVSPLPLLLPPAGSASPRSL